MKDVIRLFHGWHEDTLWIAREFFMNDMNIMSLYGLHEFLQLMSWIYCADLMSTFFEGRESYSWIICMFFTHVTMTLHAWHEFCLYESRKVSSCKTCSCLHRSNSSWVMCRLFIGLFMHNVKVLMYRTLYERREASLCIMISFFMGQSLHEWHEGALWISKKLLHDTTIPDNSWWLAWTLEHFEGITLILFMHDMNMFHGWHEYLYGLQKGVFMNDAKHSLHIQGSSWVDPRWKNVFCCQGEEQQATFGRRGCLNSCWFPVKASLHRF